MPEKYVIHAHPAPPRFRPVGKLGIIDWREDCSSCHNCVKRGCIFDLYKDENQALHEETGFLDYIYQCKGCLQCVQNCTKNLLSRAVNPEYLRLGDDYFTPDIILSTWFQAETGRIPVSGSGYGGRFTGQGFDAMWTDMSEIVRPTRDGIHGREYINTGVEIGRRLPHLAFDGMKLTAAPPPRVGSPIPILFNVLPERFQRGEIMLSLINACEKMGTFAIVRPDDIPAEARGSKSIIPACEAGQAQEWSEAPLILLPDAPDVLKIRDDLKAAHQNRIVAVRVPAGPTARERIIELVENGIEAVQLQFSLNGLEDGKEPRHMRDVLRDVHTALVRRGRRDQVTLIAGSGVALAEHVVKALICGADLVAVDLPLVIALECRLCGECGRGERCPIELENITAEYGAARIVNLMCAWRNQILEMLGAMGIREARRLRGEVGRAMFFDDLEREIFGPLFGQRKADGRGKSA
jgi:ferredoxin